MSIPALPFCKIALTAPKPTKISQNPQTLGEHIKKRRLELGLTQAMVARVIGVTESTITYWERQRTEPIMWVYPKIIDFLGYNPFYIPAKTIGQKKSIEE